MRSISSRLAFSFIKHLGESRGLLGHKIGPSFLVRSSNGIDVKNGHKGHDMLAPFNAGRQITGSTPLVEENSEFLLVDAMVPRNTNRKIEAYKEGTLETKRTSAEISPTRNSSPEPPLWWLRKVKLVRYYNRALGRPNKKTFIAPSQLDHGSTLIAARLSSFPALHQKFLGGLRAFSSRRTRPTIRMGREFINNKPLRQFTLSKAKSAGRNSAGRITIFHRGGGAKRLQRRIDLKRSTSSMGIVERIEYDPNRSSRIALVRWEKGVQLNRQGKCKTIEEFAPPPRKIFEPTTTTNFGSFSFSSMPGKVDQRKVACFSPRQMGTYVMVGLPTSNSPFTSKGEVSRKSSAKEILFSTLSPNATGASLSFTLDSSSSFPRIAVAGSKPAFFAPRMKENVRGEKRSSPCEIRKLTRRAFSEHIE